jgi:putative ABC transport system permease protein
MLMIVRERRREIGVLKAIGSSNGRISLQFVAEALTLTLMAAVVGTVLGVVLSNPVLDVLVTNSSSDSATTTAARGVFGRGNFPGGARGGAAAPRFLAGSGIGRGITQFGSALGNVRAAIGVNVLFYGLLAAVLIAFVGSSVPAYLIAKIRPAEVMRSE